MASRDIEINKDLVIREYDYPHDDKFEIRVGEPNWHRNAAILNMEEARKLRDALNKFLEG